MSDTAKVLKYLDEAAARVEGEGGEDPAGDDDTGAAAPVSRRAREGCRTLCDGLARAAAMQVGPSGVPADARMRSVKMAILTATRPITGPQGVVNDSCGSPSRGSPPRSRRSPPTCSCRSSATPASRHRSPRPTSPSTIWTPRCVRDVIGDRLDTLAADLGGKIDALTDEVSELQRSMRGCAATSASSAPARTSSCAPLAEALPEGYDVERLSDLSRSWAPARRSCTRTSRTRSGAPRADHRAQPALRRRHRPSPGGGAVVDLGIGRGEWLELLGEQGIEASGVDTSERAAKAARRRGLEVRDRRRARPPARREPGTRSPPSPASTSWSG